MQERTSIMHTGARNYSNESVTFETRLKRVIRSKRAPGDETRVATKLQG